jgi:hypothetical protein
MVTNIIKIVRQSEYTGENRCGPCTILNVVIAVIISIGASRKSKRIGIVLFGVSTMLIYLRGYLIPGTPSLTKQYLPADVLRWFGKEPKPDFDTGLGTSDTSEVNSTHTSVSNETNSDQEPDSEFELTAEQYLLRQNVVEPCEEVDDLCLTSTFETALLDEIDQIDFNAITAEDAASLFGIDTDDELEIVEFDDARVMNQGNTQVGKWPSHAALVADVTAAHVLNQQDSNWDRYSPEQKGQILTNIRLFLETCPTSGGSVSMSEETVESCCQSHDIFAVICDDTGERLFEYPVDELKM